MKLYSTDFEAEVLTEIAAELAAILVDNGVDETEAAARVRILPSNLDTIPGTGSWVAVSVVSATQQRQDASNLIERTEDEVLVTYRRTSGKREISVTVTTYRDPDAQTWAAWLRAGLRSYDPVTMNRQTQTRGFIGTRVGMLTNTDGKTPSPTMDEVRRTFSLSTTIQVVVETLVEPLETFVVTSDLGGMTTTTEMALG